MTEVDPGARPEELERGFVGLQLPATSLLDSPGYDNAGPLLEVLEEAGLPLLVHPGPATGGGAGASAAVVPAPATSRPGGRRS